jgi:hypothetical protein
MLWHHVTHASLLLYKGVAKAALLIGASIQEIQDHILGINCEARTHVRCSNFGVAGAEGSTILALCFPCEWTSRSKDDGPTHAAKFEEGKLDAFPNGVTNLRSPTHVAIRSDTVMVAMFRGERILVRFCVRWMREQHVGVERCLSFQQQHESIVNGGVNLVKHVKCHIQMAP